MFVPDRSEGASRAAPGIIFRTLIRFFASDRFVPGRMLLFVHLTILMVWSGTVQAQTTPWPGGRWTPPAVQYGVQTDTTLRPVMEDGITLQATVAYPTVLGSNPPVRAPGPFPVVLSYGGTGTSAYFVQRGWISVGVATRGNGTSEGLFDRLGVQTRKDGATLVDWAASLPGSNGKVGMIGFSYGGAAALGTAAYVKPGSPLKAVALGGTGFDGYPREIFMRGGAITRSGLAIATGSGCGGQRPETQAWCQALQASVFAGGPEAFLGQFWADRGNLDDARKIVDNGVATLLYSNWQDVTQTAAINTITAAQNVESAKPRSNTTPGTYDPMDPNLPARARYQLIIGEGGHSNTDQNIHMAWLDTFVNGQDTGIDRVANPIHMRERTRWINAKTWPLTYDYTPLYLNAGGTLTTAPPAPGGTAGTLAFDTWADQPGGTLTFTSAPFPEGATVGGAMAATIYASTSGTNLQLMARMYDVAPDGTETFLQDGILVGSQARVDEAKSWKDADGTMFRPLHTHTHDEVLTPNVPYRLDIFIEPRLWPLPPGHSLRLALSGRPTQASCPPGAALSASPCYNTDPQEASLAGTTSTILADPIHPSSVNLPLLPYLHFPTATTATLPIDWGPEYEMSCIDVRDATRVMGSRITEARFLPRADLDRNGVIDGRDVAAIARQIRGGNGCR